MFLKAKAKFPKGLFHKKGQLMMTVAKVIVNRSSIK